jgi:2-oxoglutarate ferredoxin oxidoreductase subunit alpha
MRLAHAAGFKVGLFRPLTLWPFPTQALAELSKKTDNFLVVEMNMGQMVEDVKLATECRKRIHFHGRPGGGVPTPPEVFEKIQAILGGTR